MLKHLYLLLVLLSCGKKDAKITAAITQQNMSAAIKTASINSPLVSNQPISMRNALPQISVTKNRIFNAWVEENTHLYVSCLDLNLNKIQERKLIYSLPSGNMENRFNLTASFDLDQAAILIKEWKYIGEYTSIRNHFVVKIDEACNLVHNPLQIPAPIDMWFNDNRDIEIDNLGYIVVSAEMYYRPTNSKKLYAFTLAPNATTFTPIAIHTTSDYGIYGTHIAIDSNTGKALVAWQPHSQYVNYKRVDVRRSLIENNSPQPIKVDLPVSFCNSFSVSRNEAGDTAFYGLSGNSPYEYRVVIIDSNDAVKANIKIASYANNNYYWDAYQNKNLSSVSIDGDFLVPWSVPPTPTSMGILNRLSRVSPDGVVSNLTLELNANAELLKMQGINVYQLSLENGYWYLRRNEVSVPD